MGNFEKTDSINGSGFVYYPSGLIVEGLIQNNVPEGPATIHFSRSDATQQVTFEKGRRKGKSVIQSGSGLIYNLSMEDQNSQLFESLVPFLRNYYNHSLFDYGHPRYSISSLFLESQNIPLSDDLYWWLTMCDLQQPSLTLDVTRSGMTEIVDYLDTKILNESFVKSPRFNRVRDVTLVSHQVVQQTILNYLLPELSRFKNLTLFMHDNMDKAEQYQVPESLVNQFQCVWGVLLDVLNQSPVLMRMEIVSFPLHEFLLIEPIWTRIEELVIRSIHEVRYE